MKPIVAIVGRPNVGKSTFFNRLIGERKAIVEDIPGTTRDRIYGDSDWNGRSFTVVDTAGLLFEEGDLTEGTPQVEIARHVRAQAQIAIDEADAIIFMVDSREGITSAVAEEEESDWAAKIAIVGRPNVGKSSLLNRLLGQERSVVSTVPGTTRDSIDTPLEVNGARMLLIDTTG